jgi:hypothetical protein
MAFDAVTLVLFALLGYALKELWSEFREAD